MTSRVPTGRSETDQPRSEGREARVNVDGDGDPIGIMLFLGADELERLGVEAEGRESISYRVEGGTLRFE